MIKRLIKSVLLTSVPMIALAYFYGFHGVWIWLIAFFCGMLFHADIGYREFYSILKKDFQRELRYWKCRYHRHPLIDLPQDFMYAKEYRYCKKCDALIRKY